MLVIVIAVIVITNVTVHVSETQAPALDTAARIAIAMAMITIAIIVNNVHCTISQQAIALRIERVVPCMLYEPCICLFRRLVFTALGRTRQKPLNDSLHRAVHAVVGFAGGDGEAEMGEKKKTEVSTWFLFPVLLLLIPTLCFLLVCLSHTFLA